MILCCGEALIDMIPVQRADRPTWSAYPGGAIFNTALALGRLGVPAGLCTGLSSDAFGDMLRADLSASGVSLDHVVTTDRKTALAFVMLRDGQARYSFHDADSAHRALTAADLPSIAPSVRVLFFGCISLVAEPCGTAFEHCLADARAGRLVMLDPNIRPSFVSDEEAYRARLDRMMAQCDIVKLSDEDLDWLVPGEGKLTVRLGRVLEHGPRLVIATRGSAGAVALTASGDEIALPAPRVSVVDTVGAGDTFNAGFLAGLHERGALDWSDGLPAVPVLRAALADGIAAASVVVTRAGAQPPWRHELDAKLATHPLREG